MATLLSFPIRHRGFRSPPYFPSVLPSSMLQTLPIVSQGPFFKVSLGFGAIQAQRTLGRKIYSFDGLTKPWGPWTPLWVELGAVGAEPARSPREPVESTI